MEDGGQLMAIRRLLAVLLILCCVGPAYAVRGINNERGVIAEANGGLPVNLQDQTSPALFIKANQVTNTTTVSATVALGDVAVQVADTTGIIVGDYTGLFNLATNRFYVGTVLSITAPGVNGTLNMDTPIDSAFEIGDTIGTGITNMAVNGSVTTQIFTIRGADPGIDVTADITRIIITCTTAGAVDLSKFGDIVGGLTKGLVMRRVDGFTQNLINWKTNGEIAGSMYDFNVAQATNPAQGQDGFSARLTFGGQSKLGVVVRLAPGEELQFLVQDDLSALTTLEIMTEGHVVTD